MISEIGQRESAAAGFPWGQPTEFLSGKTHNWSNKVDSRRRRSLNSESREWLHQAATRFPSSNTLISHSCSQDTVHFCTFNITISLQVFAKRLWEICYNGERVCTLPASLFFINCWQAATCVNVYIRRCPCSNDLFQDW